jgi:hypothetical protein
MQTENQKERLVELLNEATFGVNTQTLADHLKKETIERVAEYLMANNVVVLPLKVGDQIYRLDLLNNKIIDWTIARIDIYEDEVVYCDDCFNVFTDEEFGIREGVFLTLDEAEKALKEKMLEDKAK